MHTHHTQLYRNISSLARFTKRDHQTSFGFISVNQGLCTTSCDTDIPAINQTHTPLHCLSRLDRSVPRLEEEEERGGRKCNFKDTVLCMPGQHFSPFFIAFGIILQHSLSKDFGALHRYYLITVCRGMKCFSQGQSATHGRVCVISLRSHQCRKDSSPFPGGSERMLSAHPDLFCRGEGKRQLLLLQVLWSSGALWEPLKEQGTTDEHQ